MHCQLESLRFCFPPSIRRVLGELPETLDATYERALLGISKQTQDYAHRLFQCLVVSIRPLRVEELAEILRFNLTGTRLWDSISVGAPRIPKNLYFQSVPR